MKIHSLVVTQNDKVIEIYHGFTFDSLIKSLEITAGGLVHFAPTNSEPEKMNWIALHNNRILAFRNKLLANKEKFKYGFNHLDDQSRLYLWDTGIEEVENRYKLCYTIIDSRE